MISTSIKLLQALPKRRLFCTTAGPRRSPLAVSPVQNYKRFSTNTDNDKKEKGEEKKVSDDEDDDIDFPYAFLNYEEFVKPNEETEPRILSEMSEFLKLNQDERFHKISVPRLKNGIAKAYVVMLDSVATNDRQQINLMSEANLYRAFSEGLDELNSNFKDITVLNKPDYFDSATDAQIDDLFEMEVVGIAQTLGLSIDRATNNGIVHR